MTKMKIEQNEFKHKIIIETSRSAIILLQNIFNKKTSSYKVSFLDNLQYYEPSNINYNLVTQKTKLFFSETKMSFLK